MTFNYMLCTFIWWSFKLEIHTVLYNFLQFGAPHKHILNSPDFLCLCQEHSFHLLHIVFNFIMQALYKQNK